VLLIAKPSISQLTYQELKVEYDSAWTFKNLQLIPIKFKPKSESGIGGVTETPKGENRPISFSEAIAKKKVKVQEMQYEFGADVNWLQVTNNSRQPVLVQSGEMIGGGKQDRMIGETKMISPGTTDYINVYCIEKRRWDKKPKDFKHRGVATSELRKVMDKSSRQADVWKEIDRDNLLQLKRKQKHFLSLS
jgi:hypothetical protein